MFGKYSQYDKYGDEGKGWKPDYLGWLIRLKAVSLKAKLFSA
jgi:hypothetical protein